ncbi:MAG: DUF6787 family protein [Kiritimatiellia bacterium]
MSVAWAERLKSKWGIESNFSFWMIILTFSLAGSSIGFVRHIVWNLFGYTEATSLWIKVPTYIVMIFPTYQVSLLIFGTLLGQFKFFWAKEKTMLRFFARLFSRNRA